MIHVAFLTCLLVFPLHLDISENRAKSFSEGLCDLLGQGWGQSPHEYSLNNVPELKVNVKDSKFYPNFLSSVIFRSLVSYTERAAVLYGGGTWIWLLGLIVCVLSLPEIQETSQVEIQAEKTHYS